jgi:DNA-binding response OmpR family regulator
MASVLLIEDDPDLRRLVAGALAAGGHHVESAATGSEALTRVPGGAYDLIVLDLGLPDIDGRDLLRMIRAISAVPVIVATARGADDMVVSTLDAGADDYIVKPFSVEQLQARVRAVLRRRESSTTSGVLVVGSLSIDVAAREVRLAGTPIELSPKEFDVLRLLAERQGEVVSKRELLAEVWRQPYGGGDRTVDVHLSWLRKKLGESAGDARYLKTVHGVGVKLVVPEP